jgi:hypothetical protein
VRLAFGQVGQLRLAADGLSPGAPDGKPVTDGQPLADYYGPLIIALQAALEPSGYTVFGWGYDWRKSILNQGAFLATTIRLTVTAGDPCSIIAHSQGGLVARAAWANLVATGDSAKVRRIVTLGTPHAGSYSPAALFSLSDQILDQLNQLSSNTQMAVDVFGFFNNGRTWSLTELAELAATWPSLYELLPSLNSPDAAADPNRLALYTASNWPAGRGVSQAWLNHALGPWAAFLASAASLPPAEVLTTIAGTGYSTPFSLADVGSLGDVGALGVTSAGDGRVTVASALLPQSVQYAIVAQHGDLPAAANAAGTLAQLVLAVRTPPVPIPPPATIVGGSVPVLAGPPLPANPLPGRACPSYCC